VSGKPGNLGGQGIITGIFPGFWAFDPFWERDPFLGLPKGFSRKNRIAHKGGRGPHHKGRENSREWGTLKKEEGEETL